MKLKGVMLLAALAMAVMVPSLAQAWSADGHKLVCEIAWRYLTPRARAMVEALRQGDDTASFAESCTWADDVRQDRPATSAYHFINIPAGVAGVDLARDCADEARRCVPWAIKHYDVILANPAARFLDRQEALKFVSHFVGDLHQPLHAGRLADLGGNRLVVSWFGDRGSAENPMQLHRVWDAGLLRQAGIRWPDSAARLYGGITHTDVVTWSNADVLAWANESYRLCEDVVYTVVNGDDLADAYYSRALPEAQRRLQQAGVRLAFLLNEAAEGRASFTY